MRLGPGDRPEEYTCARQEVLVLNSQMASGGRREKAMAGEEERTISCAEGGEERQRGGNRNVQAGASGRRTGQFAARASIGFVNG